MLPTLLNMKSMVLIIEKTHIIITKKTIKMNMLKLKKSQWKLFNKRGVSLKKEERATEKISKILGTYPEAIKNAERRRKRQSIL